MIKAGSSNLETMRRVEGFLLESTEFQGLRVRWSNGFSLYEAIRHILKAFVKILQYVVTSLNSAWSI